MKVCWGSCHKVNGSRHMKVYQKLGLLRIESEKLVWLLWGKSYTVLELSLLNLVGFSFQATRVQQTRRDKECVCCLYGKSNWKCI